MSECKTSRERNNIPPNIRGNIKGLDNDINTLCVALIQTNTILHYTIIYAQEHMHALTDAHSHTGSRTRTHTYRHAYKRHTPKWNVELCRPECN